jgi:hypothetical protein
MGAIGSADGPAHPPAENAPPSQAQSGAPFIDVTSGHWAAEDLKFLVDRGIITGLPGGKFNGDKSLTRYEAAIMMARAVRYVLKNPSQVSPDDIKALQNLLFQVSDQMQKSSGELDQLKGTVASIQAKTGTDPQMVDAVKNLQAQSGLIQAMQRRLDQQEQIITQLQGQVSQFQVKSSTTSEQELEGVKRQASANFIVALVGLLFGIIGIALSTMR